MSIDFDQSTAVPEDSLGFDASSAVLDAPDGPEVQPHPQPLHWDKLYSGLDGLDSRLDDTQRAIFSRLDSLSETPNEDRARAINQAYIQSQLPNFNTDYIQKNWGAVKDAFAKEKFGVTAADIPDTSLYSKIGESLQKDLTVRWAESTPWQRLKMMFGSHGYGDHTENMDNPALPAIGSESAGTKGALFTIPKAQGKGIVTGLIDATNRALSGLTSPENVILAGTTAGAGQIAALANATRLAVVARAVEGASLGTFTAIGAKDTAKAIAEARIALKDPEATDAQKADAVATVVLSGVMTAAAARGTYDIASKIPADAAAVPDSAQIKAINAIREEAKVSDPKTAKMLEKVADDAESALIEKAEAKAETEKPKEPEFGKEAEAEPTKESELPDKLVGIKNEAVDAQLQEMGMEKATHGEHLSRQAALFDAEAKMEADPLAGEKLIADLKESGRAATGQETALALTEINRLRLERDAAAKEAAKARESGDEVAITAAKAMEEAARNKYQDAMEVVTKTGTSSAQGLALRAMMLKEDYSLAAMEQRRVMANDGKPLSEEQLSEVRELHQRIAKIESDFESYKASQTMGRPPKVKPGAVRQFITDRANEARERIKARMAEGRQHSGLDPADIADHAIVGAELIAKGFTRLGEWSAEMLKEFGERIRPHLKEIFDKAEAERIDASRLQAIKTRTAKKTEELKGKIESGDFSKKEKRPPVELDAEARRLKADLDITKMEYKRMLEADRYRNSSALQKAKENALNAYDAARLLMTTGEMSFILRQGKIAALSHPVMTAKALPDTFRALFADERTAHAINLKVLQHPDFAAAKAAKLHITDEHASLNKQEELLMGKLVGKIPLVKNFERAATVFLNKMRFDMFRALKDSSGGLDAAEQKQVALFINQATGRGTLGSLEPAAVPLGRLLFSPRFLASRLQIATGHSLWGGTLRTRRLIAAEYAKTLVGLGLYYTALKMAFSTQDKDAELHFDPRSSDFGKVKVGNTRIDPLAGVAQVITFAGRSATGEKANSRGKITPIRGDHVPYGGERWSDVAATFARSKLHPVPGAVVNLFNGTDLAGNKADLTNQALNLSAPVAYMDIYQALEEQDLPEGMAISLLALLGEGIQTYDANQRHK